MNNRNLYSNTCFIYNRYNRYSSTWTHITKANLAG